MSTKMFRSFIGLLFFAAALVFDGNRTQAFAKEQPDAGHPARDESWSVIYLGGQRIGYHQSIEETVKQNGESIVKTSIVSNMTIKRFGQSMVIRQLLNSEETMAGELRRLRFEIANPPAAPSITTCKIEGAELTLTQEVNGQAKSRILPWQPEVKSPVYQDRILKENPLKAGETRSFEVFNPEFAKTGTLTLKGIGPENVKLLNNTSQRLFKVTTTDSLTPNITVDSFLDAEGDVAKVSMNMIGLTIELFHVTKDEALKAIEGKELDIAISTLVKVKPLLKGHSAKRVVYRIAIEGQNPIDVIPEGDTQTLKKLDQETAELTVISIPIPASAKAGDVAAEYLQSSQYLQQDDERVKKHANNAAGDATDAAEICRRMEKYVHEKLTKKNFSTAMASAGEVAQTMEGDCTEHAVLLAAMLRVKGVPSRVAVGLVYVETLFAFGCHMWTEANLNGKWVPLDATRGARGASAAYIKLAETSLSDDGPVAFTAFAPLMTVIGKIKLDVISAE